MVKELSVKVVSENGVVCKLYRNRGAAIDDYRENASALRGVTSTSNSFRSVACGKEITIDLCDGTLYYDDTKDKDFVEAKNCGVADVYFKKDVQSANEFYTESTMEDGFAFDRVEFNCRRTKKFELPCKTLIQCGRKDTLIFRLNTMPERDGDNAHGKIFFPAKEWRGVAEGEAIITEIQDSNTCGFGMGKMVRYTLPNFDKFIKWAAANLDPDTVVYFVKSRIRGEYLALYNEASGECKRIIESKNGEDFTCEPYSPFYNDMIRFVTRKEKVINLVYQHNFGDKVTVDSIDNKFGICMFSPVNGPSNRQLVGYWDMDEDEVSNLPDVISSGLAAKIVYRMILSGNPDISYIFLDTKNLASIISYSLEEFNELAAACKEYNKATDDLITSKLRSSKLKLQSVKK